MRLADLVAASREVAQTRSRRAKVVTLARFLRALRPEEIATGAAFLAGELPRGRVGVGWAAVRTLRDCPPAAAAALELADVDAALRGLAEASGAGSARERARR